jgi:hypothetical protein
MSDKHLGRIENTGDSGKLQQFSQPWTLQMMTPKLDLSGAGTKMPSEFGDFQLVDNSNSAANGGENRNTRQLLQGSATFKDHSSPTPHYHSAYDVAPSPPERHQKLNAGATEIHASHKHAQSQKQEYLAGQTTIPASKTPDGIIPSETLQTNFPVSSYREGAHFSEVLAIPAQKDKTNYYNGLAEAHYENGHLKGVPVHVVNGKVTSHLDNEVDIPLHRK